MSVKRLKGTEWHRQNIDLIHQVSTVLQTIQQSNTHFESCTQARNQVWIWGGVFQARVDLFACFLGESGIFLRVFCKRFFGMFLEEFGKI